MTSTTRLELADPGGELAELRERRRPRSRVHPDVGRNRKGPGIWKTASEWRRGEDTQLNLYARAELTEGTRNGFEDAHITMVAARPFIIGYSRLHIVGYFEWVPGLGSEDRSYHLNPQLKLDVGNSWGNPDKFYVGLELDSYYF